MATSAACPQMGAGWGITEAPGDLSNCSLCLLTFLVLLGPSKKCFIVSVAAPGCCLILLSFLLATLNQLGSLRIPLLCESLLCECLEVYVDSVFVKVKAPLGWSSAARVSNSQYFGVICKSRGLLIVSHQTQFREKEEK